MTALIDKFGEVGDTLEQAVSAEVEKRTSALFRAIAQEVELQLAPVKRHQAAEKTISDDRHETLSRKLDQVLEKLGTNGSGGHG